MIEEHQNSKLGGHFGVMKTRKIEEFTILLAKYQKYSGGMGEKL